MSNALTTASGVATVRFRVSGMTCEQCGVALVDEVRKLEGVHSVTVDIASGVLTVDAGARVDHSAIGVAIYDAGYDLQP